MARWRGAPGPLLRLARAAYGRPGARAGDRRRAGRARGRDGLQQLGGRRPGSSARGRPGAGRPLPARAQLERGRGAAACPHGLGAPGALRARALRPRRLAAALGPRDPAATRGGGRARPRCGLGGHPARWAESVLQSLAGGRARHVGAGRGDSRRAARASGPAPAPPRVRGRSRACRHGVGVAARRDPPQARPHRCEPARAHRPLSGLSLCRLLGAALRMARGGRSGALLAGARGRRRRALGGRRRLMGRAGLQPPRPGNRSSASCSSASAGSRSASAAAARSTGAPTPSATTARCRRSCASAGSSAS